MTTTAPMQWETIRLSTAILVAVLALRLRRLWRTSGNEGRQSAAFVAGLGLRRARLRLTVALLARLIVVVALHEGLRILRKIGLLSGAERLLELSVFVALIELLIGTRLELLVVPAFRARLKIRVLLAELLLRGSDQAEIMFGMLEVILGRDRIAGGLGIACKLEIFLRNVIGRSANLHIRAVRLVNPCQGILIAPVVLLMIIAPAHTLVVMMLLTVSHGLLFNDS
jgi:hypothetical protein